MNPHSTEPSFPDPSGSSDRAGTSSAAQRLSRLIVGVVAPLATLGLILGPVVLAWSELPDPLATGWTDDGMARTPASPTTFLAIQGALAVLCAALFVLGGLRLFATPIYNGTAAVIAAAIAPTLAVVSMSIVSANRGVNDWREAADPGPVWVVLAVVLPFVGIVAAGWFMRSTFLSRGGDVTAAPSAGLSITETESAAWHSGASAGWPWLIGVPLVVAGVVTCIVGIALVGPGPLIGGVACLVAGLSVLVFSSIQVAVDRRGLTVRYGPLPWPTSHIALSSIKTAIAIDVRPSAHGGWGYRGSRRLFGKAAVVVRGGDGIRIDLADGTEFVVTVDDAEQGAGVLNDLRAAAR